MRWSAARCCSASRRRLRSRKSRCSRSTDLHVFDERGLEKVDGVSFDVRGRARSSASPASTETARRELIDALTGLLQPAARARSTSPATTSGTTRRRGEMLDLGVGHIPEDRQRRGLVLEFSIAENIALHDYDKEPDSRWGWLYPNRLIARAAQLIKDFDVRGGGPKTRAGALSGGNQQKVIVAREVARDPKVLIAAQPTRGLDVGAIEYVHRRLVAERDRGRAILLVSLELEEILSLSDRILVMFEGRDRRRVPADRDRGGARHRDDRRTPEGAGGGMTTRDGAPRRSRSKRRSRRSTRRRRRSPAAPTTRRASRREWSCSSAPAAP